MAGGQASTVERRHERLLELLGGGVVEIDDYARVVFMNSAARSILGLDSDVAMGRSFIEFVSTFEPLSARAVLLESAAMLEPAPSPVAAQRVRGEGEVQHLQIEATTLAAPGDGTEVEGMLYLITDVTARTLEHERQRELQKLEALGQLAAGVAHDFNNALHTILTNAEEIEQRVEDEAVMVALDKIGRAVSRARDVVAQILAFGRGEDEPVEGCSLCGWLDQIVPLVRSGLRPSIELHVHRCAGPLHVTLGRSQLSQLLLNLVSNACQAIPDAGGTIEIRVDLVGGQACLSVRDDGEGMRPEVQARIFEPYFSTRPAYEGSGLGLSVVHGMVTRAGGRVEVESKLGAGTVLRVLLPCVVVGASSCSVPAPAPPVATSNRGHETIFVVDDEPEGLDSVQILLERRGYHVEIFTDPERLLEVFERDPARVDLLLSDQLMPGMSGVEVAETIWRARPELPVILCTGTVDSVAALSGDPRVRIAAKPVSVGKLAELMRELLDAAAEG